MICPFCNGKMKEVSREEYLYSDCDAAVIDIIYQCTNCGKEPTMHFEFEGFYDEDDNPIEVNHDISY
jgi:YgiT-type zinc finger domain-containing protein